MIRELSEDEREKLDRLTNSVRPAVAYSPTSSTYSPPPGSYNVKEVLDSRADELYVLWETGEKTWEPRSNMLQDVPELVKAYDRKTGVLEDDQKYLDRVQSTVETPVTSFSNIKGQDELIKDLQLKVDLKIFQDNGQELVETW